MLQAKLFFTVRLLIVVSTEVEGTLDDNDAERLGETVAVFCAADNDVINDVGNN